jgi:hypothetical protein
MGDNTVVDLHREPSIDEPTKTRPLRRRPVEDDTLRDPAPQMPDRGTTEVDLHPPSFVAADRTVVDRAPQQAGQTRVSSRTPACVSRPAPPTVSRTTLDLSGLLRDLFLGEPTEIKPVADEEGRCLIPQPPGGGRGPAPVGLVDEAAELWALLDDDDFEPPEINWRGPDPPTWLRLAVTAVSCLAVLAVATVIYVVVVQW